MFWLEAVPLLLCGVVYEFTGQFGTLPSAAIIDIVLFEMAQLLVRNLDNEIVKALKQKATEEGTSVEEAHRRVLRAALLAPKPKKTFKEFLLETPQGGEDTVFERHTTEPREVSL